MLHGSKENSMLVKCLSACTHLSSTVSEIYIELLVENFDIFRPHLCLAAPQGVPSEFREDLSTQKTRMNGLSCSEEIMTRRSAVLIGCQRVTDRQTDGRTDVQPINYVLQDS